MRPTPEEPACPTTTPRPAKAKARIPAESSGAGSGAGESQGGKDDAAYWKRQAEKHAKEAEKLRRAQMSDAERAKADAAEATKRAEAAEGKWRQATLRGAFEREASKLGVHDLDGAFRLADLEAVSVDEDGKVKGLEKALKALQEVKPYLFGQHRRAVGSGGGVTSGAGAATSGNQAVNDRIRQSWRR
ncbi:MAG: phage scaffolding protein [Armatimonadetes bacterium]|nr:phage scaffolding protein [Armatimonadota bacterium]